MSIFMEEMTWREIQSALETGVDSVLIPLGAIEQHGPHLPIFTDTWLGYALCGPVASKVGRMLVAPPVYPGRSEHHMAFPGTITVSHETFKAVVKDYCRSLARHGFKHLVLLATHGGNFKAMHEVLPEIQAELADVDVFGIVSQQTSGVSQQANRTLGLDPAKCGQHAGLTEASMLLATRPELVHMEYAVEGWMGGYGPDFSENLQKHGMKAFSEFGILGDPREATAETGVDIIEERSKGFAEIIRTHLETLDEPVGSGFVPVGIHRLDSSLLLEERTSREIGEAIADGWNTLLVMLGAIEQHGPHLPLGTDTMLGYERGVRLAKKLGKTLVAPVIRPGLSEHHMRFPGTITLQHDTFINVVLEFCTSVASHGFRNLILIPTHGGNYAATEEVYPQIQAALPGVNVVLISRADSRMAHAQIQPKLGLDPAIMGVHAGLGETSYMLTFRPELVHMDRTEAGWVGNYDEQAAALMAKEGMQALSPIGVLGDPRGSSVELGNAYLDAWTDIYAQVITERLSGKSG